MAGRRPGNRLAVLRNGHNQSKKTLRSNDVWLIVQFTQQSYPSGTELPERRSQDIWAVGAAVQRSHYRLRTCAGGDIKVSNFITARCFGDA
jgi:hypothetical protein